MSYSNDWQRPTKRRKLPADTRETGKRALPKILPLMNAINNQF